MKMSDKTYDTLKWIQKILVLLAAFYVSFAETWGLPFGTQMQKTFLDLATILLGILEIASARYNKEQNEESDGIEREDPLNIDIVSHEDIDGVG